MFEKHVLLAPFVIILLVCFFGVYIKHTESHDTYYINTTGKMDVTDKVNVTYVKSCFVLNVMESRCKDKYIDYYVKHRKNYIPQDNVIVFESMCYAGMKYKKAYIENGTLYVVFDVDTSAIANCGNVFRVYKLDYKNISFKSVSIKFDYHKRS